MSRSADIFVRYNALRVREIEVVLETVGERLLATRQATHRLSHPPGVYHPPGDTCHFCDARAHAEKLFELYAADYAVVAGELVEALLAPADEGSAGE